MSVNIKQKRTELHLTLEQIGDFVGVSKSTVKKWENGYIKNMRRDKILLLAKILNVSPLDFLTTENTDTPSPPMPITAEAAKKTEAALGLPLNTPILIYSLKNQFYIKRLPANTPEILFIND